jgi:putative addiction module component (TIGR02574 family)
MTLEELKAEALKLSSKERADLAYELICSLDGDEPEDLDYERLWREEIARRMQTVADGTAEFYPADEVLASIRATLGEERH